MMDLRKKNLRDNGGGCSICGSYPTVNLADSYWICWGCAKEHMRDSIKFMAKYIFGRKLHDHQK